MKKLSLKIPVSILSVLIALSISTVLQTGCQKDAVSDDLAGTTVKKYIWYNNIPTSEKASDEYFEQQTGAKIERIMVPWESIDLKFTLDISAGTPVDVVYMNDQKFPTYPIKGIVQPLDDLLSENDPLWKSSAMNVFAFGGKHYGIATGITPLLLWYNKTMFEENDVKTPNEYYAEDNWNWDTFSEVAKKLTVRGADGTVQKWGYSSWRFDAFMLSNAGSFVNFLPNGSIELALAESNSVKALQFMQDGAFTDKWMDPTGNFTWGSDFQNGNVAMTCEAAFLGWNGFFDGITYEVDFAPLPLGPDNVDKIYPGRADAAGVCAMAKNPQGAIEYIRLSIEYSKLHEDTSEAKTSLTESQYSLNKALGEKEMDVAMFMGIGDLQAKEFGLWDAILTRGVPVATAIATETPGWQNEIDVCLKNNSLPLVTPFVIPDTIDFENGISESVSVKAGEETGVTSFEVSDDPDLAIEGKSLIVSANPDSEIGTIMFMTNPGKIALPAYHVYTVTFDYKVLEDFAEGGILAVCLRPYSDPINGANVGWVELSELTAGSKGSFSGEFTPITTIDDLSVVCIGQMATKIAIDNINITDVTD